MDCFVYAWSLSLQKLCKKGHPGLTFNFCAKSGLLKFLRTSTFFIVFKISGKTLAITHTVLGCTAVRKSSTVLNMFQNAKWTHSNVSAVRRRKKDLSPLLKES